MKEKLMSKTVIFFIFFIMTIGESFYGQEDTDTVFSSDSTSTLRWSEPLTSITADLKDYLPGYMQEQNIPGVAIALIQDGKVAWTGGFGVMNTITREPVTLETLFEVASNSKLVTAYIALRLVDQGVLALDEPLNQYLSVPWLPPSEYRDAITLRHVLSHSTGLGHLTFSRECIFPPGSGFYYSNKGFLYLQAVIEEVSGQPLEEVAQELVFKPLGMLSSSFINHSGITGRTANGHLHAIVPVLFFVIPYLTVLLFVWLIGLLILRIWKGHWRTTFRMVWATLILVFVLVLMPIFIFLGKYGLLKFAWLIAFCGISVSAVFAGLFYVIRTVIRRLFKKRARYQSILATILTLFIIVIIIGLLSRIENLPVPKWPTVPAGAASTLRVTTGDLAMFLIELSNPQYLSHQLAEQLQSPQVWLAEQMAWGLGPGIQQSQDGKALWQWGQNLDFQSVVIIYPQQGFGAVVMTNNDLQNPDVAIKIAHRLIGSPMDLILRASHLDFNYSGEN